MLTFQAVYHKGVLKPDIKLDLPENAVVQVQVLPAGGASRSSGFGALKGIWRRLPEGEIEQVIQDLASARKLSSEKLAQVADRLDDTEDSQ
ncbi:MAG: antitoxin AF2212-like protein [Chloroflexota bacterium]